MAPSQDGLALPLSILGIRLRGPARTPQRRCTGQPRPPSPPLPARAATAAPPIPPPTGQRGSRGGLWKVRSVRRPWSVGAPAGGEAQPHPTTVPTTVGGRDLRQQTRRGRHLGGERCAGPPTPPSRTAPPMPSGWGWAGGDGAPPHNPPPPLHPPMRRWASSIALAARSGELCPLPPPPSPRPCRATSGGAAVLPAREDWQRGATTCFLF